MSLTAPEIEQVVNALQLLIGAVVQKIHVPLPRSVFFEVRKPQATHLLLLCAETGFTRLHLAESRLPSPNVPYAFQGLLRAELTGTAIESIKADPGERLVTLRFAKKDGSWTLMAELTGRHGNFFLIDEQRGVISGSAVPNLSQIRDNRPSRPYVPPLERTAPPTVNAQSRFTEKDPFSLSQAIAKVYQSQEQAQLVAQHRASLMQGLHARQDRLQRTIKKVQGDVERAGRADEFRRQGELLKANLGLIRRGMSEITLTEYTTTGEQAVKVRLDQARGPRENLERLFHQYRRLTAGHARATERLAQLQAELMPIQERLHSITSMSDQQLLETQSLSPAGPRTPSSRKKREAAARPFREYVSSSGQRIRVGRGAKENDALTFGHAKGNDIWMHARHVPGAHVIICLARNEPVKDKTLQEAALLAAHFSDARGEAAQIAWTRVKYVRKQQGAPGAVTYSQDKTLFTRPDQVKLARLLEAESGN